jgi:hypothetical protein
MIREELGLAPGAPFTIPSSDIRGLTGVASGPIVWPNDFWGKPTAPPAPSGNFDYIGYKLGGSGPKTTWLLTGTSIGTADANRLVSVAINWSEEATHRNVSEVRFGGISGTLATIHVQGGHSGGSTGFGVCIASAVVPTGTTSDVRVVFSGDTNTCNINIFRYVGLASTTPNDTATIGSGGTATDLATTIDILAGGLVQVAVGNSTFANGGTIGGATSRYTYPGEGAMSHGLGAETGRSITWDTTNANNAGNALIAVAWA